MTRFRESTGKQVVLVFFILAAIFAACWMNFPGLRVWSHSMRLHFEIWPPAEVVGDMLDCKHPAVIKVLAQYIEDRRTLDESTLNRWPDFDGYYFGEFCHWQIQELAYEIDLSRGPDEDRVAIQEFMSWLAVNYDDLKWDQSQGFFILPGDSDG